MTKNGKKTAVETESTNEESFDYTLATQEMLKRDAYKLAIASIRSRLELTDRLFSKIAHAAIIEETTNLAAKTILRPYCLMWSSIITLIGMVISIYYAKDYGYSYNYLIFFYFLLGGYLFGLLLELITGTIYRKKDH